MDLYDAALQPSSRKAYRTGQRAYDRFVQSMRGGVYFPFQRRILGETELNLAFFIAFLVLEPRITKATTILGYTSHVKYVFREEGCPESEWKTPFLAQVRKGLRNTLPSQADMRQPLLLPSLITKPVFQLVRTTTERILRFATIMGFVGMLRPNAIRQFSPRSVTMVTARGERVRMPSQPDVFDKELTKLRKREHILGFYIEFQSKTIRNARAYFPSLCVLNANLKISIMCPVKAVIDMSRRRLIKVCSIRLTVR